MTLCNWQICRQNHVLCGRTTFVPNQIRYQHSPYAHCSLDKGVPFTGGWGGVYGWLWITHAGEGVGVVQAERGGSWGNAAYEGGDAFRRQKDRPAPTSHKC